MHVTKGSVLAEIMTCEELAELVHTQCVEIEQLRVDRSHHIQRINNLERGFERIRMKLEKLKETIKQMERYEVKNRRQDSVPSSP